MARFTEEQRTAYKNEIAALLVKNHGYSVEAAHKRAFNGELDVIMNRVPDSILEKMKPQAAATIAQYDKDKQEGKI
jgi:Holliday junction resolvase-like predicted endonuclease